MAQVKALVDGVGKLSEGELDALEQAVRARKEEFAAARAAEYKRKQDEERKKFASELHLVYNGADWMPTVEAQCQSRGVQDMVMLIRYIKEVLEKPEFQREPVQFLKDWKARREMDLKHYFPEDTAMHIISKMIAFSLEISRAPVAHPSRTGDAPVAL